MLREHIFISPFPSCKSSLKSYLIHQKIKRSEKTGNIYTICTVQTIKETISYIAHLISNARPNEIILPEVVLKSKLNSKGVGKTAKLFLDGVT